MFVQIWLFFSFRWGHVARGKSRISWEDKEACEDTLFFEKVASFHLGRLYRNPGWRGQQQRAQPADGDGSDWRRPPKLWPIKIQHRCVPGQRRNRNRHSNLRPARYDLPVNWHFLRKSPDQTLNTGGVCLCYRAPRTVDYERHTKNVFVKQTLVGT